MHRNTIFTGAIFCALLTATEAQSSIVLQAVPNSRPFKVIVPATDQSSVVEASTDLVNWVSIQTNSPSALPFTLTDFQSGNFARRFYRVRSAGALLPDLAQFTNSVFMASEGFNTLQYAPNGKLGFIVWRGQDLVYRERNGTVWSEQVIGAFGRTYVPGVSEEYRFQPQAALLFDSQSHAHVLRLNGASVAHHIQQNNGTFVTDTPISLSSQGNAFSLFSVAIGPGDKLHIALVPSQPSPPISYGSNKNGTWQWSVVTNVTGDPRGFLKQSFAPRWFSLAVDAQNNAHLTFCPQFVMGRSPEGYLRPYSTLFYASDRAGTWVTEKIADVADASGDAGAGASIAIGPDNQPAIAAWYNERFPTGSSLFCQLNYYHHDAGGAWSQQLVASTTAGYLAGDSDKGTGFAPYLRFDFYGRPNIAFCDDAAQHFPASGQNEYAGDLRHAYFDGSQWIVRTVYAQTNALDHQIVYPAMATTGDRVVFIGLDRQTVWVQPNYRIANSTYQFFFAESGT